jgi:hypothetical protein
MDDLFGNVKDLGDALLTLVSLRHVEARDHRRLTLVSSENWSIFAVRRGLQPVKWTSLYLAKK